MINKTIRMKFESKISFNIINIISLIIALIAISLTLISDYPGQYQVDYVAIFTGLIAFLALILVYFNLEQVRNIAERNAKKAADSKARQVSTQIAQTVAEQKVDEYFKTKFDNLNLDSLIDKKLENFIAEFDISKYITDEVKMIVEDLYNGSRL